MVTCSLRGVGTRLDMPPSGAKANCPCQKCSSLVILHTKHRNLDSPLQMSVWRKIHRVKDVHNNALLFCACTANAGAPWFFGRQKSGQLCPTSSVAYGPHHRCHPLQGIPWHLKCAALSLKTTKCCCVMHAAQDGTPRVSTSISNVF